MASQKATIIREHAAREAQGERTGAASDGGACVMSLRRGQEAKPQLVSARE